MLHSAANQVLKLPTDIVLWKFSLIVWLYLNDSLKLLHKTNTRQQWNNFLT